ncbi:MAG: organoarsenical effux MFS transporter ArsJ [Myxococcota bacterium]
MSPPRVSLARYAIVAGSYCTFTVTDGALRMLVLLHFHALGYTPTQLALLFVLYEFFGIVVNLVGGYVGTRWGLTVTLVGGIVGQIAALLMLCALSSAWPVTMQVGYVMVSQGLSGIAKDLTKTSSKSAIKLVAPDDGGTLFRWVALVTGSKNAAKGFGFFVGGALLAGVGFVPALLWMAAGLAVVLVATRLALPWDLGRAPAQLRFADIVSKSRAINVLSAARLFLFGARDVWFVVALPVFLHERFQWGFSDVAAAMAVWVIGYGAVQAATPKLLRHGPDDDEAVVARRWGAGLTMVPAVMVALLLAGYGSLAVVLGGLAVFGVVFAVNSAVHSYLILRYTDRAHATANVGFYYMANAAGRLLGTLLSGLLYHQVGFVGCLAGTALMLAASTALSSRLPSTVDFARA